MLTHGEMLSERIASQISEIGQSSSGKAKCEILRKVCFADLCGVRLSAIKLSASQSEDSGSDFGELLKGMESEFLVHVNEESAAQTQDIQLNITEMLCLLKNKLPVKDVDWLIEICDNVFSGEKFDDIMFNNVIEHFIQKKIEQ